MAKYHREVVLKICQLCGVEFTTINLKQKYCNSTCSKKAANKAIHKIQKSINQKRLDNLWRFSDEGIRSKFQELFNFKCSLCQTDEDVISTLREGIYDYQVLNPDNWTSFCRSCLQTIESYNASFDSNQNK